MRDIIERRSNLSHFIISPWDYKDGFTSLMLMSNQEDRVMGALVEM